MTNKEKEAWRQETLAEAVALRRMLTEMQRELLEERGRVTELNKQLKQREADSADQVKTVRTSTAVAGCAIAIRMMTPDTASAVWQLLSLAYNNEVDLNLLLTYLRARVAKH